MSKLVRPHGGDALNPLLLPEAERADARKRAATLKSVPLSTREVSDLFMLAMGAYTPIDGFMGQPYQNVVAVDTITNLPGNPISGSLSWDIDRDYRGPTQWWHGTDMAVVQHGEGRMILSMLKVVENLGRDPVADKILFNVIKWTAGPTK